jgi:hypothetical protein
VHLPEMDWLVNPCMCILHLAHAPDTTVTIDSSRARRGSTPLQTTLVRIVLFLLLLMSLPEARWIPEFDRTLLAPPSTTCGMARARPLVTAIIFARSRCQPHADIADTSRGLLPLHCSCSFALRMIHFCSRERAATSPRAAEKARSVPVCQHHSEYSLHRNRVIRPVSLQTPRSIAGPCCDYCTALSPPRLRLIQRPDRQLLS